jgi:DNA-binding NarL/FixJ family response regulator
MVLLLSEGLETIGLKIDQILMEQNLTIKPFGKALKAPPYFYGCTILGDGRLVPVVDSPVLLEKWLQQQASAEQVMLIPNDMKPLSQEQATVLVIDDSLTTRQSLCATLQQEGYTVIPAQHGKEGLAKIQQHPEVQLVICDLEMPEMNGLEMIERILKLYPKSAIIMNTIQDDSETIFKALQLGASGYIDKQSFETKFTEVFECIGNGGAYMTPKIARRIIEFFKQPRNIMQELTVREKDIVNGILDGLSYKMIANKHDLAIDTVRMYVKKVYRKLSINSKSELFKLMRSRL